MALPEILSADANKMRHNPSGGPFTRSYRVNRFKRGSGCYKCSDCGKQTRDTGEGEAGVGLCKRCYDLAGEYNVFQDGFYTFGEFERKTGMTVEQYETRGRSARGNPESSYTISRFDIGRTSIRAFGRVWLTSGFIGRILPRDVGKKVYLRGDILQVENDEQFSRRVSREGLTRFNDTPHRY